MAVYSPGNVEISTTISIGVIGVRVCPIEYLLFLSFFAPKKSIFKVMVMVILFYLWLCAVSLYQSLKEIQNLGSDQVKILRTYYGDMVIFSAILGDVLMY